MELDEKKYLYLLFLIPVLVLIFLYGLYWKRKKQKEFGDLSVAIDKIRVRAEAEAIYHHQFLRPFVIKHYNFTWYNELTKNGLVSIVEAISHEPDPKEIPAVKNVALFNKIEAENMASYYQLILRGTRQIQLKNYNEISHKLLVTLRKEYNLIAE